MDPELLRERIKARLKATRQGPVTVSTGIGKGRDYLSDFLNGKKQKVGADVLGPLAAELECSVEFLMDANVTDPAPRPEGEEALVPIRGYVGASPDGRVTFGTGDPTNDFALVPVGANRNSLALYVNGHSMRGIADHGALIFYEETRTPPTPDMLNQPVVVQTEEGDVMVKYLRRGSRKGFFDLESTAAEPLHDVRLTWAAHIQSIVPPYQARRLIRSVAA